MRLTLRTLLAYLDDTLEPAQAALIGQKLAESAEAQKLVERIRKVTRRRGLSTPPSAGTGTPSDPNTVAGYLSDSLPADQLQEYEKTCWESDTHLAEVAACHQILTLLLSDQVRVPPTAYQRMYRLVKGRESIPGRKPGNAIPVGGVIESPVGEDDSDAPFLLGITSGTGRGSPLRWVLAAALAAGFVLAVLMIWPKGGAGELARNSNLLVEVPKPEIPKPADDKKEPIPTEEKKEPMPPLEPKKEPMPSIEPVPMPTVEPKKEPKPPLPPVELEPNQDPLLELVPAKLPPRNNRLPGPELDPTSPPVLFAKLGENDWKAAAGEKVRLLASDRAVALPGFKVKLNVDGGQMILWGNAPEIQPIQVLESSITSHDPYQGYAADFTINVGRVYLLANRAGGTQFRVRFLEEIWDVTVADKSEAVIEVEHAPALNVDEQARTYAMLHVNTGSVMFRSRYRAVEKVNTGEELAWTSFADGLIGPRKPDPKSRRQNSAYYSRFEVAPSSEVAVAMKKAVANASKRLPESPTVAAAVDELLQDQKNPAAASLGVYAAAALGEYGKVADALNDPRDYLVRQAGRHVARELVAMPGGVEFLKTTHKKLRLDADGEMLLSMGLRGLPEPKKKSAEVLDFLIKKLDSDEIAIRDLAHDLLVYQVDPAAVNSRALFPYDAAAPAAARAPLVQAWRNRAEDLKKTFDK